MVPFDVVAGGDCVISNSGGVTHLRKGFKMLDLSVMQSSLCFAEKESVTIPATGVLLKTYVVHPVLRKILRRDAKLLEKVV